MDVIHKVAELRSRLAGEHSIALVPTMGSLHAGHLTLVDIAKNRAGCVVASIFVNRLQFAPGGDFDRYPRTLAQDCALLEAAGCHVVFAPDEHEMYPQPQEVTVVPPQVARHLEGEHRPGHFEGVVTVVAKLFNIVRPHAAIFGKKDYQQLHVIRALERQLDFGIAILGGETVREADGLAMSSRNNYLSSAERAEATRLARALARIKERVAQGERDYARLEREAAEGLVAHGWRVDYVALRERATLAPPSSQDRELVALGAAWIGKTRLIDSLEL